MSRKFIGYVRRCMADELEELHYLKGAQFINQILN
jgi:hypothetical protein